MNPIKKLAKDTAIYGVSSIVGRFLNWWLVPYYSFIFAPDTFGIVTNLYSYVAFLLVLLTFGMETGFFRFASKSKNYETVYSTSLLFVLFLSVVFILLTGIFRQKISGAIGYPDHAEYIFWMALVLGIDALTAIPFASLRQKNRPVKFAFIKIVNIASNIGFNIFFYSICPRLNGIKGFEFIHMFYNADIGVGYVFISNLISSFVTLLLLLPEIFKTRAVFEKRLLFSMIGYSFPILIIGITGMINQNIDKILIPFLIPQDENPMFQLGIYGANYKLAVLMNMFIQAFRYAFEPFFFTKGDGEDSMAVYARVMKYFIIFGLLIFLGIMLYIDILKILISPSYHKGLKVIPIVLAANLFLGISFVNSVWYKLKDKTWSGAYISIAGSVISLVLNILLIPVMGYMGSAWAVFACFLVTMVITYLWGHKHLPIPYDLPRIGFYTLITICFYICSVFLSDLAIWLKYSGNTSMLAIFIYIVLKKEKADFFKLPVFVKAKKENNIKKY
jgi:O-antigen/teichoic acid export membrane protein